MTEKIRRMLSVGVRALWTRPGKLLLGPTGRRLWMDYLDPAPGFSGRADFIHKMNLPLLFTVYREGYGPELCPMRSLWRPDESEFSFEDGTVSFTERKLITWEDQALSLQSWENRLNTPLTLCLSLPEGAETGTPYVFPCGNHGITPVMRFGSSIPWRDGKMTLAPGEKRSFLLAAAVGLPGEEERMEAGLRALLDAPDAERLLQEKADAYMRWFEDVPDFECDDALMEKCWYYRFYLLRNVLCEPGLGHLPGRCVYEGRGHRMPKTPLRPTGWEFSRVIPLSTPLQVTDLRWLGNSREAREALRALTHCLDERGVFAVTAADTVLKEYANYASWALYLYYLVTCDLDFVRQVLPAFKTDARNVFRAAKGTGDSLQVERTHALTGKEYQPSFWYFAKGGYPHTVRPAGEGYTPLKRVDRSVYSYLNYLGLSRLCALAGDGDEAEFASGAARLKRDILTKMWDPATGCFYDLHFETDEKALVKNIVAFYPLWAGITGEEHLAAFDSLLSESCFALGSGFASTAADCPVFSPDGGWQGLYFKGRNGCMWNGPSWPYTTGIALDALAKQSKAHGHAWDAAFEKHLREYTLQHFRFGDVEQPCLVEFYDSRTGEPLSDEADYCHSFWIDLIVRHIAGIEPEEEGVFFRPVRTGLGYFCLKNLRVRGRRLDVYYQRPGCGRLSRLPEGYTVAVDGTERSLGLCPENVRLF